MISKNMTTSAVSPYCYFTLNTSLELVGVHAGTAGTRGYCGYCGTSWKQEQLYRTYVNAHRHSVSGRRTC